MQFCFAMNIHVWCGVTQTIIFKVVADFKESSALSDPSERRKLQTQTLTAVFETYFRILKTSLDPTNRSISVTCTIYRTYLGNLLICRI